MSGLRSPVERVPRWSDVPAHARADLEGRGYDSAWFGVAAPDLRLTVLNLYYKLSGLGLWRFVTREDDSERGRLQFRCADLPGLLAALRRLRFAVGDPSRDYWDAREKRLVGSLHLKHFHGWPRDKLQAHIDRFGFWLRWWWWAAFPVQAAWILLHSAVPESYLDVVRLRRILLRRGAPADLLIVPPPT